MERFEVLQGRSPFTFLPPRSKLQKHASTADRLLTAHILMRLIHSKGREGGECRALLESLGMQPETWEGMEGTGTSSSVLRAPERHDNPP